MLKITKTLCILLLAFCSSNGFSQSADSPSEEEKKAALEKKNLAAEWKQKNPKKIKLQSLINENWQTVEAYFGKPVKKNFSLTSGTGRYSSDYTCNLYASALGKYKIISKNASVYSVDFTPNVPIAYKEGMFFGGKSDLVDLESGRYTGGCGGTTEYDMINGVSIVIYNLDCDYGNQKNSFYIKNNKVTRITSVWLSK